MKGKKYLSTINKGSNDVVIRFPVVAAEVLVPSLLTSSFAFCKM